MDRQRRLLADCESVLRTSAASQAPTKAATIPAAAGHDALAETDTAGGRTSRFFETRVSVADGAADLPGGGLQAAPALAPVASPDAAEARRAERGGPGEPDSPPRPFTPPPSAHVRSVQPSSGGDGSASAEPQSRSSDAQTAASPVCKFSDIDLMHCLDDGGEASAVAESELSRRGFRAIHLQLAKRLIDPDPRKRRDLADWLPRIAGVDARPWLLWLSRDVDPDVRLAAVTIMATSSDPELHRRLRGIDAEETDQRAPQRARSPLSQAGRRSAGPLVLVLYDESWRAREPGRAPRRNRPAGHGGRTGPGSSFGTYVSGGAGRASRLGVR